MDCEHLYQLVEHEAWHTALAFVHRHHKAIAGDPRAERAVQTFEDEFFRRLDVRSAESLSRLVLLHSGRMHRLSEPRFERAVARLVALEEEAGDARAALSYARLCPENARCRAAIARYAPAEVEEAEHAQSGRIRLAKTRRPAAADHTLPLFKSRQEEVFFAALREAFPTFVIYPNVALSALINFEALRDDLTPAERRFFFKGLVDAVVFDAQRGYRPRYFFELDSPFHDAEAQRRRDAHKDRIVALAGRTLYRVRSASAAVQKQDLTRLVIDAVDMANGR